RGERELLARHARNEAPAANLSAGLEAAVDAREVAPRRRVGLSRQQPPEDDAVAPQQRARLGVERRLADVWVVVDWGQRPPAAGERGGPVLARLAAASGLDERAQ